MRGQFYLYNYLYIYSSEVIITIWTIIEINYKALSPYFYIKIKTKQEQL